MIHPVFCYLGVTLVFGVSLTLFVAGTLDVEEYFYAPIVLLIAYYTAYSVVTDKNRYRPRTWKQAVPKAVGKTVMWGLIVSGVIAFYGAHPLYRDFTVETRHFLSHYLKAFWIGGPIYFLLAEKFRYSRENCTGDPYLRLLSLLKALVRFRFRSIGRRLVKRPYRRFYMMALLRIHYIPIMVGQVYVNLTMLTAGLQNANLQWTLPTVLWTVTLLSWLIDSNNAAIGYFWESWFTKTRFRDMDPYPIHWFVVLMCYVPFVGFVGQFVPFPSLSDDSVRLFQASSVNTVLDVVLVTALVLYMLSGCALWFCASNLCYKKIQTRGPYAIVRHPATTCKLVFFFVAFFRYRQALSWTGVLCFSIWLGIYVCRALVEERFLRHYAEYRNYMKKTPYRFIPRLC